MAKVLVRISAIMFSVLLFGYIVLACVLAVGLDDAAYRKIQVKYEIADYAGMDQETLDRATAVLITYMDGKRADIEATGMVNMTVGPLFNNKEKIHMADVRDLFRTGKNLMPVMLFLMVLIILACMLAWFQDFQTYFFSTSLMALGILLSTLVLIAAVSAINFTVFWDVFHRILFTNDLYLLDPRQDLLIRMMPERFFISLSLRIVLRFMVVYVATMLSLALIHGFMKGRRRI
ncbi:MAG: TIGR01906 family membrane protein [Clostridia bacterium]